MPCLVLSNWHNQVSSSEPRVTNHEINLPKEFHGWWGECGFMDGEICVADIFAQSIIEKIILTKIFFLNLYPFFNP